MQTTVKPTPQQRWHEFQTRLPSLTRRQKWLAISAIIGSLLAFTLCVLPFLLPLAGPKPQAPSSLADPNGHFILIEGQSIYYEHYVNKGEVVILIHGQAGSTRTWSATMPALQTAGYDVYALDQVGLGLSAKGLNLDHSHAAQARRILIWMDELGIEKAYLVAHAFGSNIAVHMAQLAPERIQGMALAAPTLFTEPTPEISPSLFEISFLQRWARVGMHFIVHEAIGEQLRSATKIDEVVTNALIADYGRVLATPDWDLSVLAMLRDSSHNALPQPLVSVQQPILLLWGTEDGWATPDNAIGLLEKLPNSCLVTFADVGHLAMHEVPHEFSEKLIEFFQFQCKNQ